jgi:hypothetical protein
VHALDDAFVALTRIGSDGAIWILIALIAALYWRRPAILLYVVVADLAADISSALLRWAIGRERPPVRFPDPRRSCTCPAAAASRPAMLRRASPVRQPLRGSRRCRRSRSTSSLR